MKKGNANSKSKGKAKPAQDDELDLSRLNETVEETERRRDAEANLAQLGRGPAAPTFDAPFAPGLGSAGVIPNNEDGDFRDSGSSLRIDLGDGSIEGMSDLNDISGNPQVYNGPKTIDDLADLSEGGIGGMTIEHINDINHGTGALPEEVEAHEAKRTAQRVRFKTTEGNPLLQPAPPSLSNEQREKRRSATRGTGGMIRSGADTRTSNVKSETTIVGIGRGGGAVPAETQRTSAKASRTTPAKKSAAKKSTPKKSASTKASAKKSGAKKGARKTAARAGAKTASKKSPAKSSSGKSASRTATAKKSSSKKSSSKNASSGKRPAPNRAKNSSSKKSSSKKSSSKKSSSKKSPAKKSAAKTASRTAPPRGAARKVAGKAASSKRSNTQSTKSGVRAASSRKSSSARSSGGGAGAKRAGTRNDKAAAAHKRSTNNSRARQSVNVGPPLSRGQARDVRFRSGGSGVQRSNRSQRSR